MLFNQANDDEEDVYDDNLHLERNSWICMLTYVRGASWCKCSTYTD